MSNSFATGTISNKHSTFEHPVLIMITSSKSSLLYGSHHPVKDHSLEEKYAPRLCFASGRLVTNAKTLWRHTMVPSAYFRKEGHQGISIRNGTNFGSIVFTFHYFSQVKSHYDTAT